MGLLAHSENRSAYSMEADSLYHLTLDVQREEAAHAKVFGALAVFRTRGEHGRHLTGVRELPQQFCHGPVGEAGAELLPARDS